MQQTDHLQLTLRLFLEYLLQELKLQITYAEKIHSHPFGTGDTLHFVNNSGINTGGGHVTALGTAGTVTDWYNGQTFSPILHYLLEDRLLQTSH
jgi:hypothetical protein